MQNRTHPIGLPATFLKRHVDTPYEQLLNAASDLKDSTVVVHLGSGSLLVRGIESMIDLETGEELPASMTVGLYQLNAEPSRQAGGSLESFIAEHGTLLTQAGPVNCAADWLTVIPVLYAVEQQEIADAVEMEVA